MSHPQSNHDPKGPAVHRITEARESHTSERDVRVRKYVISMSVRMVCFVLAFFVEGWLRWAFLVAAVVLPYIAVVIANGGADITKREPPAEFFKDSEPAALPEATPSTEDDSTIIIDGTLVDTDVQPEPARTTEDGKEH